MGENFILTTDWHYRNQKQWYRAFASDPRKQKINILEIGTYEGGTVIALCEDGWLDYGSTITCVDPFGIDQSGYNFKDTWLHNINLLPQKDQIIIHEIRSEQFFEENTQMFDLVYIDGHHEYDNVLHDGRNAHKFLNSGGVLIFDDYHATLQPDVYNAVNDLEQEWQDMQLLHPGFHHIYRKL